MTLRKRRHTFIYMQKSLVHDRKSKSRNYRGEAEAADLLEWLNPKNPSDVRQQAKDEVASIVKLVQSLYEMANKSSRKGLPEEFKSAQTRLNEWLMQYEFVNRLDYEETSGMTWSLSNSDDLLARDYVKGEAESIARIVELARMGLISRVRRCECGQYFFACFQRQRFHAKECREHFWEASPQRKEQKRKKAKEYYGLHKNHNTK